MFDKPIIYHVITAVNTLFMYCPKNRTKIKKTSKSIAKYALKCYNIHEILYIGVASMPTGAVIIRKGVETMGLRFRKSIKIGKNAKLNINKKSVGMSVGGKGARYTVNSSRRRTKSVGIPGTGLSYVSTSGSRKSSSRSSHGRKASGTSKGGCLLMIIIFCAISVIVVGISRLFGYRRPTKVKWTSDSYSITLNDYNRDIDHIIYLNITGETDAEDVDPKDIKIKISNPDVCQLEYDDNGVYVTYDVKPLKDGFADVTATYDGVTSDPITITVDMGEKVTNITTTTTTTAEPETTTEAIPVTTTTQDPAETIVYITASGDKYHNKSCRYYDDTCTPMTLQDAQNAGYKPCKVCGG